MKTSPQNFPWFNIEGGVPSRMRHVDWSASALGLPEAWPPELHAILGLMLECRSPAAMVWGPGLTTLYNDAYALQLGAKHPASLGKSFREIWSEIWPEVGPVVEGALAGKSFYFEDLPYTVHPGGIATQRWYTSSFSPMRDGDGAVVGIYITANETTRRMQVERRYSFQSELAERLRPLIGLGDITAAACELLGNYLGAARVVYAAADASEEVVSIERDWTGGALASMAGEAVRLSDFGPAIAGTMRSGGNVVVADLTADARCAPYVDAYAARGIASFVAIPLMKNERLRAILAVHDSRPRYWTDHDVALAQDMVDRTWSAVENARSQAELRAERDQSQYIFDSMTEGFALLDRHWVVLRMNAEGFRITQRAAHEVIGKNHWDIFPELKGSIVEEVYRRVKETGKAEVIEMPYVFPDQRHGWVEVRAYPALDGGLAFFFRDITVRRANQEALRDADRRKDEFLAMLAHELRNPLAPIGAAAELLQTARLDEARARQTSQIISRQVRHMTSLVDDLLDVSRLTRGLVELDATPIDIRHIVADAVEQVSPLMRSRQQLFDVHVPPDTIIVSGDKKRLVQVIANILNNAAKYTQEGGRIALRVEVQSARVAISVEDNGVGMTPELAARAFDLFAQAERTSDRASGGLGLGLALVKNLVELHHGTVRCASAGLGRGSTFTVCLPRSVQGASGRPEDGDDGTPRQDAGALRILVVDDNVDAASMLCMLLEASGHEVMIEHGSLRALDRARMQAPEVCLLDIGLPDIDGIELARRMRAEPETARALLIAITGYGQEQDRERTMAAGFDHHLVKPVDIAQLAAVLEQYARTKRPRAPHSA